MHRSLALLAAASLVACGPTITVTQDPSVPVPGAATYVWGPAPPNVPGGEGVVAQSPVIKQRVKTSIDNELRAKGYRLTDSTQAAFVVRFAVGSRTDQTQVSNAAVTGAGVVTSNACGGASCTNNDGWDYGWYGASTTDVQTKQSGVVVDLVDLRTATVAWRGIYRQNAKGKVPTQEEVQVAVDKLMKKLPPAK
jgi:hypothetical protein